MIKSVKSQLVRFETADTIISNTSEDYKALVPNAKLQALEKQAKRNATGQM